MWDKIASLAKPFAPAIASALTGNIPGAAVNAAIALKQTLFGKSDVSDDDLLSALQVMTPEQRQAAKEADYNFMLEERRLILSGYENARNMFIQTKSNVPERMTYMLTAILIYIVTLLFFTETEEHIRLLIEFIATQIVTAWLISICFWFGSSPEFTRIKDKLGVK